MTDCAVSLASSTLAICVPNAPMLPDVSITRMIAIDGIARRCRTSMETGKTSSSGVPVSMDVRHRLAIPSMAIILVIDTSGSMGAFGTQIAKVELAKETAQSVIDLLGE